MAKIVVFTTAMRETVWSVRLGDGCARSAGRQPNLKLFQQWFTVTDGDVADKVEGIFRNLAQLARHPK